MFHKYAIKGTDRFHWETYPDVAKQVLRVSKRLAKIPGDDKSNMIVSFLKDHCLKNEWIASNKVLTGIITSDTLATSHIESLFDACRTNVSFLKDFEVYMHEQINLKRLKQQEI